MRPRVILAAAAVLAVLIGAPTLIATASGSDPADSQPTEPQQRPRAHWTQERPSGADAPAKPSPTEPPGFPDEPDPTPAIRPAPSVDVTIDVEGFLSWALLDHSTDATVASDNATETSSTESMIKAWIVADYLRTLAEDGDEPSERDLADARRAIRDSHNGAAERLYRAGGGDDMVERMTDICDLTDTYLPEGDEGWWSRTEISALDAARLGGCLADGRAAGPEWTEWVLQQMEEVRGSTDPEDQRPDDNFEGGRWGIIDGLPGTVLDDGVAIKNGWTRIGRTNSWHLSCLAVTDDWSMAVLMRYPAEYSLDYGAQRCADVARQLIGAPPAGKPPPIPEAAGAPEATGAVPVPAGHRPGGGAGGR